MSYGYYDYGMKNNTKHTTAVFNNECVSVKNNNNKFTKLGIDKHTTPGKILLDSNSEYIIMGSDDDTTQLILDEKRSTFDIFNISIPLNDKLQCKSTYNASKEIPINLHHSSNKTVILNFEIPLMMFRPGNFDLSAYSILCYTNYGFFGIYPVELMDLTDKSEFSIADCEKGKLPCVFNTKITEVELPPDKDITLNIHLINSNHIASNICNKFRNMQDDEIVYNIDYIIAPVYMILDNFEFSIM